MITKTTDTKRIDLSCLIGQQVLMEFYMHMPILGFLTKIAIDRNPIGYQMDNGQYFTECQIYQHPEYWIANPEGKLELPDGLMLKYLCFRERETPIDASSTNLRLTHQGYDEDVFAVQVCGLWDNWKY